MCLFTAAENAACSLYLVSIGFRVSELGVAFQGNLLSMAMGPGGLGSFNRQSAMRLLRASLEIRKAD